MNKTIVLFVLSLAIVACKKEKFSPEGPTDVRVKNLSDKKFMEVIVNTSGGTDTLGDIEPGDFSEYFRFEKAFPKAEISARIGEDLHSTGSVDYTGMTYIGQAKITYEVVILNPADNTLQISNCSLDAPLD